MPKTDILDVKGNVVGDVELSERVFGIEPNEPVVHEVVTALLANRRQGTKGSLTRSEVRGGGKKPWRQKGTGRARQGSTRAPQWRHGGIVFAPKPRDYRLSMNKKVRRLAMKSAFSSKVQDNEFVVVDSIALEEIKTKTVVDMLSKLEAGKKALIVMPEKDEKVIKSARNIPGVKTALVNTLNVYDILNCDKLIVAKGAVTQLEEVYA